MSGESICMGASPPNLLCLQPKPQVMQCHCSTRLFSLIFCLAALTTDVVYFMPLTALVM